MIDFNTRDNKNDGNQDDMVISIVDNEEEKARKQAENQQTKELAYENKKEITTKIKAIRL